MGLITDRIRDIRTLPNIDCATSNVITQGNIAVEATTPTKNFAAVTYTGNGTSQNIVTGISSVDFTVSSNGSGYWLDRTVNQVKTDAGVVQASGSCVVNTSKVHIKGRSIAFNNCVFDGIRGSNLVLSTDQTAAEAPYALDGYNSNGVTVSTTIGSGTNAPGATYILYQTLYTHIKWGVTSQGKFQIEAYNPVTKEGMIYYLGSGLAGHQISHSQGVDIDYADVKDLTIASQWNTHTPFAELQVNTSGADTSGDRFTSNSNYMELNTAGLEVNTLNSEFIMYYKCKSETFTIGTYTGTGAAGNFIETKDVYGVARRPARVIFKAISSTGDWVVRDNRRGNALFEFSLLLNNSVAEYGWNILSPNMNGFTLGYGGGGADDINMNTSGITYLYLVEFDTNGDGGDSYFPLPTDDTNLNLTGVVANYTNGKDINGFIRSTESVTASVDFTGVSDGFKWVAKEEGGLYSFYDKEPSVGLYKKLSADDNRLVFSDGKYYTTTGGELVIDGDFSNPANTIFTFPTVVPVVANGYLTLPAGASEWSNGAQVTGLIVGEEYYIEMKVNLQSTGGGEATLFVTNENTVSSYYASVQALGVTSGVASSTFTAEDSFIWLKTLNRAAGDIKIDYITIYKVEPTLGTPLTTPISLIPNPIMVQSETPQYIDYSRSLSENVMESLSVDGDLEVVGDVTLDGNLSGMTGFDLGQSWVDVTSERSLAITYTNDTGKPISITIGGIASAAGNFLHATIDGVSRVGFTGIPANSQYIGMTIPDIPSGSTYVVGITAGTLSGMAWTELR